MKYILLTVSILLGVAGASQAMDVLIHQKGFSSTSGLLLVDLRYATVTLPALPLFVQVLTLSFGFFTLYLIWQKIRSLKIGKLADYIPG